VPPRLVVVTGPPGAGKTILAEALRDVLGLPLIAKDALKERLGEHVDVANDRAASQRLGLATFAVQLEVARELLAAGVSLIVEGNFLSADLFAGLPPAQIAQVHVTAAPDTLRTRLLARHSHRHPVHYDREAADEIAERARAGDWGPLPLAGTLVEVDTTTSWPDPESIVSRFVFS
jgi:predicted kinase